MAQGLSIPSANPQLRAFIKDFTDSARSGGSSGKSVSEGGSDSSQTGESDVLELGTGTQQALAKPSANGLQIAPDGTYQFSRTSLSASLNYSLTEATVQTSQTDEGSNVFASLTNLNVSISVSAEYEEALIQTGRSQSGDPVTNFSNAARQAVERVKAQRISAAMNFKLSFSQSSISFGDAMDLQENLDFLAADGSLAGYATLLQSLFGDDGKFGNFIQSLRDFLTSMGGGGSSSGGVDALTQAVADGSDFVSVQSQSLQVEVNVSFESTSIQVSSGQAEASDPIVFDLDGDGIELTDVTRGVSFDLDADGSTERAATVTGGDGLLALDKNGNGKIDNGTELFGDQSGAANGFAELSKYDSNGDGSIDAQDAVFDQLRVLVRGADEDSSSLGQLLTLTQAGISSINLDAKDVSEEASGGNRIAQRAYFTRTDGTTGAAADALLNRLV